MRSPLPTETIAALEALVREPGFLYTYAWIIRHDLYLDPAEAVEVDWRTRLSFQELSFLGGLLVKAPVQTEPIPTAAVVADQAERTYQLFAELHDSYMTDFARSLGDLLGGSDQDPESLHAAGASLVSGGEAMAEAIFYGGSGAYDFQYLELSAQRYRRDAEWLNAHIGFTIDAGADMAAALRRRRDAFRAGKIEDFEGASRLLLDALCFTADDLREFGRAEAKAFLDAFSLTPGTVNVTLASPGEYNALNSHPFVRLPDGRRFLPVFFNLAQSLYESPTFWMTADSRYADKAAHHRGVGTEDAVAELLRRAFGPANVFQNVVLRQGKDEVGEIDVLALLGNKALIVQCKSKGLTLLARSGDVGALQKDFQAAVQSAYEQGVACRELIHAGSCTAHADGEALALEGLDDAFVACVLSNHYPALTHQTNSYLQRKAHQPQPWVLTLFDLDIVTHYLSNPFELLYYVRQRVALADKFFAVEEMELLAYHLRYKLFHDGPEDRIFVDPTIAQLIDGHFPIVRGRFAEGAEPTGRLLADWKNEAFDEIVRFVSESGEPELVDAVFYLYDLAGDTADELVRGIQLARQRTEADGRLHTATIIGGGFGVSFTAQEEDAERAAFTFAQLRKHKAGVDLWLGLGAERGSDRLIDFVAFSKEPWQPDAELDALAARYLRVGTQVRPANRNVGRNEPCPCGSGLKYKRCHGR
jgi:hypothetical protein